jgi:DNA-binding response OmpR family regulator
MIGDIHLLTNKRDVPYSLKRLKGLRGGETMSRILVIEDDEKMRVLIGKALGRARYEVAEAADGDAGLRSHRDKPADLIITDLIMPEKEGVETIMEFKHDYPEVKIIAISGGGFIGPDPYLSLAKKLGADSVLAKPFELKELLKLVEDLLA